jgi:hypothetical protein
MKIDTEIRHVTKAGANLFLELGFSAAEAKRLHAASRKQIDDVRLLKERLLSELSQWIVDHGLRQADVAQILRFRGLVYRTSSIARPQSSRSIRWSRC